MRDQLIFHRMRMKTCLRKRVSGAIEDLDRLQTDISLSWSHSAETQDLHLFDHFMTIPFQLSSIGPDFLCCWEEVIE